MSETWSRLTAQAGRCCVMSLEIDERTLDQETERQIGVLMPMLCPLFTGNERHALDYGCGAGRFTAALASTISCRTTGFDPCRELIDLAPKAPLVDYITCEPDQFFGGIHQAGIRSDVIFAAMVLGHPNTDTARTIEQIVSILKPGGLMIVVDHMPAEPPYGTWWHYRRPEFYEEMFGEYGVALERIGAMMQLDKEVTVLAGRKT